MNKYHHDCWNPKQCSAPPCPLVPCNRALRFFLKTSVVGRLHGRIGDVIRHPTVYPMGIVCTRQQASNADDGVEQEDGVLEVERKRDPSLKKQAQESNKIVYDKLIEVFRNKNRPEEWKKLIVYSTQWPSLAPGVFARMEEIAGEQDDPDEQLELIRCKRRLQVVSDAMASYKELLEEFRTNSSVEWESLVAQHRAMMGPEFFEYIELRVRASISLASPNENATNDDSLPVEAELLATVGTQLAVLVDAYDRVVSDTQALDAASQNFADLLQSETMESAEAKLDDLAASGKLDPALLLTMAKAYSGVKETDITKEEVKDIMAHLYFKAKEKFASQAPAEARILKFLLSIESDSERMALLEQAFQPGAELSTSQEDYVHTTPDALLNTIDNILMVYDGSRGENISGSMAGQAASLMNPGVIESMKGLRDLIRKRYM